MMTPNRTPWSALVLLAALFVAGCGQEIADVTETAEAAEPEATETADEADADPDPATLRTEYHEIKVVEVAGDLEHPWSVAFLPDGGYLVTERPGRLQLIRDGSKMEVSGVPDVHAANQGGLLDVSLHPDFEDNRWVYLTYSSEGPGGTATTLARGRLDGEALVDVEDIFVQDRYSDPGRHYGSRLAWMEDGTLLMSIGDRGVEPPRAQDIGDHAGSLLRLTEDGGIPDGNQSFGNGAAKPELYSYGHRNIQGIVIDPDSGDIWVTEHGPRGGDELNLIKPGENYGWPVVSRGRDYRTQEQWGEGRRREGMVDPVYEFLPTLAPSGLALVTADHFPRWQGNLLAGGLRGQTIRRLVIEEGEVVHDEGLHLEVGRIRDVRQGPNGDIYVLSDEEDGGLYRVEPVR
jgi:aldose sugar dehydrogenase